MKNLLAVRIRASYAPVRIVKAANKPFLPPAPPSRLNQPFDGETEGGGGVMSSMTRRKFLKRSGGATLATVVAWQMSVNAAHSECNCEDLPGGSSAVEIHVATTRFSTVTMSATVTPASGGSGAALEALFLALKDIWDRLDGTQQGKHYVIGNPQEYKKVERYTVSNNPAGQTTMVNNNDGTWTYTIIGEFTIRNTCRVKR